MPQPFMPDLDSLPPQPIEVLLLALTTPPGPEESQSFYSAASHTPYSSTPQTTHPSSHSVHYHPAHLAYQLARQLRNPTNQRGVGAGPAGASGSALVGAGVLGDVIRSLRRSGSRGAWDVVAAWVEGSGKTGENGSTRPGESGAPGGGGTAIERALLWTALSADDDCASFDPEEWADRDKATRALTDGGRAVLGLHRFVGVVGRWVERACLVISSGHAVAFPPSSSAYAEAQKCIDASLRLLEDVLRFNAPRFDEPQVVQVVEIFCRAVGRTMGGWEGGVTATGSGDEGYIGGSNNWTGSAGGSGTQIPSARQSQTRALPGRHVHKRHPSSLSSPLASPSAMRMPEGGEPVMGDSSRSGTMDTSRSGTLDAARSYPQDGPRSNTLDAGRAVTDNLSAPYVVTASRFVALVRALQRWTHVPPSVLQMMLEYLALVLAYVKTPLEVLRLGGKRRRSGAGIGGRGGADGYKAGGAGVGADATRGDVDWLDAYSRAELEGEVSGAFKVLLSGPYAVAVGRMLLALLMPVPAAIGTSPTLNLTDLTNLLIQTTH